MGLVILAFLGGLFFFNGIPHLARGICGKKHMTPFSRSSRAVVNVIWGWINLIVGGLLLKASGAPFGNLTLWLAFIIGGMVISVYLAVFWSNPDARLPWHKD